MYKLSFILIFLSLQISFAQENEMKSFNGFYNGANLQIECRTSKITPWQKCDCIDSVRLNYKNFPNAIKDGVQVNLTSEKNLKMWEKVNLEIYHAKNCELRILNPYHFYPQQLTTVDTVFYRPPFLEWKTEQNFQDLRLWVQIEQYKWGEWTKVGRHFNITTEKVYIADISAYITKGENQFRVAVSNIEYDHFPSNIITFTNTNIKKAKAKLNKKTASFHFNRKLDYIVYNANKEIALRGLDEKVSIQRLAPGEYTIYYSNRIKKFKIKN